MPITVVQMKKVAVIGAGSWGTTVAALAANRAETALWARRDELAQRIAESRVNADYLPDLKLPATVTATSHLTRAIEGAELVVMAVPSHGFRSVFGEIADRITLDTPVISLTKGIEQDTLQTMTGVVRELQPARDDAGVGVLTGPNLAAEIAAGQPAAAVVGMSDAATAAKVQEVFMQPTFRVYTNTDLIGCELGGALKNVMAIASGISDGLGFGDNTRATLLTRALAELTRLGTAMGGRSETFAGLAGMGDLIATCSSSKSRNHTVGYALAEGKSLAEIITEMRMVAEGVKTTKSVLGLAARHNVDMPIAEHVSMVLDGEVDPREAMLRLMTREAKPEHD